MSNPANFIIKTILENIKTKDPYRFAVDQNRFYKIYNPMVKNDISKSIISTLELNDEISIKENHIEIPTRKIKGFCLVQQPNILIFLYVVSFFRKQGLGKNLFEACYNYLHKPDVLFLKYPIKSAFNFFKSPSVQSLRQGGFELSYNELSQ